MKHRTCPTGSSKRRQGGAHNGRGKGVLFPEEKMGAMSKRALLGTAWFQQYSMLTLGQHMHPCEANHHYNCRPLVSGSREHWPMADSLNNVCVNTAERLSQWQPYSPCRKNDSGSEISNCAGANGPCMGMNLVAGRKWGQDGRRSDPGGQKSSKGWAQKLTDPAGKICTWPTTSCSLSCSCPQATCCKGQTRGQFKESTYRRQALRSAHTSVYCSSTETENGQTRGLSAPREQARRTVRPRPTKGANISAGGSKPLLACLGRGGGGRINAKS